ncbi:uncharacterized protein CTRU02_207544 [Colletotrichum truncatum]|uniref:Uncharacterized protein n=1 Tax=Colletotrichum truncatum TaxID=5467 RepID=A0ACC3Z141_COLTU|nr:uncharacterized protein CTRU02_00827 [Colletotrichum truncatum]KAF6800422.1 hypothetical protein CTRU02_00827 [Colletotrichum truncatum]
MPEKRPQPSQSVGVPHTPAWKKAKKAMRDAEEARRTRAIEVRREKLQQVEMKYKHLPTLPPQLPSPRYVMQGGDAPGYHDDDASMSFYKSCAEGDLNRVRTFVDQSAPTPADLSYALEEACQNLQLEVVRFLLRQPEAELHYRCFRRCVEFPDDENTYKLTDMSSSQSIFRSGSPELLNLLKILVDFGWHPNQLLGPLQSSQRLPYHPWSQEVALHYPRCILDMDILRFLLDVGADPTIARDIIGDPYFDVAEQPVQRLEGHILELAVNLGAKEAVTLLVSHGAKLEHGIPLHSLARRRPDPAAIKVMDEEYLKELYTEIPDMKYPTLSTRLDMAQHLIALGDDINKVANVYRLIRRWIQMPVKLHEATALSQAKNSMDWDFVRWLLENGADPAASPRATAFADLFYAIGVSRDEITEKYEDMIRQYQKSGHSVTATI